ncbi:MAG TPA: hypothetical protein VGO50_09520 [Pyrinomonadaceae bacterium]|jgi:tetratricopeptide (TPR) repeat protein|nr:hypothetical protein [Pyrinomonadaceae bacterium]
MRKISHIILHFKAVFVLLATPCILAASLIVYAQTEKPLTSNQIESMILNRTPDNVIALEIQQRGLEFSPSKEYLEFIKKLGAGPKTVLALTSKSGQTKPVKRNPSDKITILVANFSEKKESSELITDFVINQLIETFKDSPKVRILALNEHISLQQGRPIALQKASENNADIVVWGSCRFTETTAAINSQVEILFEPKNNIFLERPKIIIGQIGNFKNLTAQLQIAKEISFLSVVSLALVNLEIEDYQEAVKYLTIAIAQQPHFTKLVSLPELYILRATSHIGQKCGFFANDNNTGSDIEAAIKAGAEKTDIRILRLRIASARNNSTKGLEYARAYFSAAKNDDDISRSMFLLMLMNSQIGHDAEANKLAASLLTRLNARPETSTNLMYLAFASAVKQDVVKFLSYLEKLKKIEGLETDLLYALNSLEASIYKATENYKLAIESLKKNIQLKPQCSPGYLALAEMYYEYEEEKESEDKIDYNSMALSTVNQAIELNPDISDLYVLRAKIIGFTDSDRALSNLLKASEIDPESTNALNELANFYKVKNKSKELIDVYTKLLRLNDDVFNNLRLRAELYIKTEQFDLAINDYRDLFESKTIKAKDAEFNSGRVKLVFLELIMIFTQKERYDLGVEFANKYIQLFPEDADGYETLSGFLEKLDQTDAAINAITNAIKWDKENARLWRKRANYSLKRKDTDKAMADLDQSILLDPNDELAVEARAKLYMLLEKLDLAMADYEKLLEIYASGKSTLGKLSARSLIANINLDDNLKKKPEILIRFTTKFIQYFPKESAGFRVRATTYSDMKNVTQAIQDITTAIALEPNDAYLYFLSSRIFEASGDIDSAIKNMQKAVEMESESSGKERYKRLLESLKQKQLRSSAKPSNTNLKVKLQILRQADRVYTNL